MLQILVVGVEFYVVLTIERLKEVLNYDPETGEFVWKKWRERSGPKAAGCISEWGYRRIKIDLRNYRAARLAWFYMTGEWPDDEVDHINLMPSDDRWCNLRSASKKENCSNKGVRKDNKSGFKGVYSFEGKFRAAFLGKHLGTYERIENAALAYNLAAVMGRGDFARLNK